MKHSCRSLDLSKEEITELLDSADRLKAETKAGVEQSHPQRQNVGHDF